MKASDRRLLEAALIGYKIQIKELHEEIAEINERLARAGEDTIPSRLPKAKLMRKRRPVAGAVRKRMAPGKKTAGETRDKRCAAPLW